MSNPSRIPSHATPVSTGRRIESTDYATVCPEHGSVWFGKADCGLPEAHIPFDYPRGSDYVLRGPKKPLQVPLTHASKALIVQYGVG